MPRLSLAWIGALAAAAALACAQSRPAQREGSPVADDKDQVFVRAHGRALVASCEEALCNVWVDGAVVANATFDGSVDAFIAPLGAVGAHDGVFLLSRAEGEQCPHMAQVLQVTADAVHVTETFGNCAPLTGIATTDDGVAFHFASLPKLARPEATYLLHVDDDAVAVRLATPAP